jgi:hypothetical protein
VFQTVNPQRPEAAPEFRAFAYSTQGTDMGHEACPATQRVRGVAAVRPQAREGRLEDRSDRARGLLRPAGIRAFEKVIEIVKKSKDVRIGTRTEGAAQVLKALKKS